MSSVFLSYARRDAGHAEQLRKALLDLDIEVWDPASDLQKGDTWRDQIKAAIEHCDALVAMISSPEAAISSNLQYEVGAAEGRAKQVIVLVAHDLPHSELPVELADYHVTYWDPGDTRSAARAIRDSLRAMA
jgi:hypothetical protein